MGGGVVKALILQFFFEIWKWFAHEATNHDCPEYYIFYRDIVSFQECFIFCWVSFCLAFWKRKNVYIQWCWCLQWMLHYIVVHITIFTYIYIHYLTIYCCFFHNSLCFSINMYLILNIHDCNVQRQILYFLKRVLHPFMLFMSAFQKRTWPDWTCTSSKDGLIIPLEISSIE